MNNTTRAEKGIEKSRKLSLLGEAALGYAGIKGMPVFPCQPRGKRPLCDHGLKDATTDKQAIRAWWQRWPDANLGYPTGDVIALDVDGPEGERALAELEGTHGELPKTTTIKTGRGFHKLFNPGDLKVPNSTGKLGPHLDIRGVGGYIILPPSVHESGKRYELIIKGKAALLPKWILEKLAEPKRPQANAEDTGEKVPKGQRNDYLIRLAGAMRRRGASQEAIEKALAEENRLRCDPPLEESEVLGIARSAGRYEPASGIPDEDSKPELTTITLSPGESPRAVDEAERILLAHREDLRIFQRAGEVVRVVTLEETTEGGGLSREAGTVQLGPVGAVALTETFDRLIQWQRIRTTKEETRTVRVDCPGKIAAAYLSRLGFWGLPHLNGIISAPIMRPDGSILCRAGYDAATGLYLTEDWGEMDGNPSRDDALVALETLKEPFLQFPFVASEDRSVLIAAILTALERRLLESAPLFASSAPTQRTGKTLAMEVVAITATGRPAPAMAVSGDREEMRKAVAAALREGHSIVNLDNIEHPLGSPDLSRAITQPEYSDRLLGETRILRLPTNVLWTATGNNLAFRGDLAVRALVSRLDARVERPEEREFKIRNLKGYILEHRRNLVAAALTVLRAYVAAGRPDQSLSPWGGFDEWSRTIRAPLVWLGMADPCDGRQHVLEDDPDREQAAALLSAWHSFVGGDAVQLATVIHRADENIPLKNALLGVAADKSNGGKVDPRRLGWWCRTWRDRVVGGLSVTKGRDYGKSSRWAVEDRSVSGISGISGIKSPSTEKSKEASDPPSDVLGNPRQGENNPDNPNDPKIGVEDREVI